MLLSMTIVVGAMMASTFWSFRKGLSEYIQKVELERVEMLIPVLAQAYQDNGGWLFLRGNRRVWIGLLDQGLGKIGRKDGEAHEELPEPPPLPPNTIESTHLPNGGSMGGGRSESNEASDLTRPLPNPPPLGEGILGHHSTELSPPAEALGFAPPPLGQPDLKSTLPPPPCMENPEQHRHRRGGPLPHDPVFLGRRLRLLDENRLHVIGPHYGGNDEEFRPIVLNNATVGWLAVRPITAFTDRLVLSFLEQQKRANTLIFALALGLSMLVSIILARVFLAPIRRLANGVQALVAGQYDTQIIPSSQDELGQLAKHFNLLAHTLQSNETARRQWIADIAHELRTPLAILKGEIEAMQDGIRQPTADSLRSLHGEVSSLTKLVGDLHELSVSDLGAMNYRREQIDLAEVLRDVCDQFRQRFANNGLELVNRVEVNACYPVFADPSRLFQLFSNLMENSCRYTDSPGLCEISIDKVEQNYVINFRDSAPGVPEEALSKLFERLYRVDKSRSRELGGSGLGLSICKNIVEAHGGMISAKHCDFGGVWIQLTLPRLLKT